MTKDTMTNAQGLKHGKFTLLLQLSALDIGHCLIGPWSF